MAAIFISYRHDDAGVPAGRLEDALKARFGSRRVFRDTASIPAGTKWDLALHEGLASAQVILVLIGDRWLVARDQFGQNRLDDPDDYVRREIEHGLGGQRIRVVPILLEGVRMPTVEELPDSITGLVEFQAFRLSDAHWPKEIASLLASLEEDVWRQSRLTEWRGGAVERARGIVAGGQRKGEQLRHSRTFDRADVDIAQLAHLLAVFYEQQKLQTQVVDGPRGPLVQARAGGIRAVGGMAVSLTVSLREEQGKLVVEIGPGRWADKALATAVSPWIPPLLLTAAYGAWRQRSLPGRTYRFISAYLDGLVPTS